MTARDSCRLGDRGDGPRGVVKIQFDEGVGSPYKGSVTRCFRSWSGTLFWADGRSTKAAFEHRARGSNRDGYECAVLDGGKPLFVKLHLKDGRTSDNERNIQNFEEWQIYQTNSAFRDILPVTYGWGELEIGGESTNGC